jgi:putative holliday junction resolvase
MHKSQTLEQGTYLAFDFGTKRLGIAVGQTITKTASPLLALNVKNGVPTWQQLDEVINKWQPRGLVVGLALQPDGSPSATSLAAQRFGKSLQQHTRLPVYYIEERLTSIAAQQRLKEDPPLSQAQQNKDAIAAAIILESWLNRESMGKSPDESCPPAI